MRKSLTAGFIFFFAVLPLMAQEGPITASYTITRSQFEALVSDQPPEVKTRLLADPARFLEDYRPLFSYPWDLLVLVDKRHELAADYVPKDLVSLRGYPIAQSRRDLQLRKVYIDKFLALDKAMKKDGLRLEISSSYRSWIYQRDLFQRYVNQDGVATAEKYSARAGHSQHQLGTVVDFGSITPEFAVTKEGQWLFAHAGEYGFSLSYPEGKEPITGYSYEPWHYRYIGVEAAKVQKVWFSDLQQWFLEFNHLHGDELKKALKK